MSEQPTPADAPTAEQLQAIVRDREASLLKIWTSGRRLLTAQEMAELRHILPPALLANPPAPSAKYKHALEHYAQQTGYQVRNIKRWIALGKQARRPCPLDDPQHLADWWEEMKRANFMKIAVPAKLLDYVTRLKPAQAVSPVAAPAATPSSAIPAASAAPGATVLAAATSLPPPSTGAGADGTRKINFNELAAVGLEGARNELTLQLSVARDELRKAREDGLSELVIQRRQKTFDAVLDSLRKTESAYLSLQKERGDLAPKSEFRADLVTLLTTLRGMKRKLADNVCGALAGQLGPEQLALVRAAIAAEGEREERLLRSARHWKRDADGNVIL